LNHFVKIIENGTLNQNNMNSARNKVRNLCHEIDPESCPLTSGIGTDIRVLLNLLMTNKTDIIQISHYCNSCHKPYHSKRSINPIHWLASDNNYMSKKLITMQYWINNLTKQKSGKKCTHCNSKHGTKTTTWEYMPNIIVFHTNNTNITLQQSITIQNTPYTLCGTIYSGSMHFTARLFTSNGDVWLYDGIEKGNKLVQYEGNVQSIDMKSLNKLNNRDLIEIFYSK
jgi:hypothetical protein